MNELTDEQIEAVISALPGIYVTEQSENVYLARAILAADRAQRQAGQEAVAYQGPARFTADEIKRGNVGIRWVTATQVCGRPTEHDLREYLLARGPDAECGCKECNTLFRPTAPPAAPVPEGWISVDARLPRKWQEVLVWPNPTDYCMTGQLNKLGWTYGEYDRDGHHTEPMKTPTHWMPLPTAPDSSV